MRKYLLLCVLLLAGCGEENDAPGDDLLDRGTFKSILTEAHLIEARVNHEMVIGNRRDVPMQAYYEDVFANHNTDSVQFQRTFEYYSSKPAELRSIYEEIITELSRRKDLMPIERSNEQEQEMDTVLTNDTVGL